MFTTRRHRKTRKVSRLRLTAGALAVFFAFLTGLPWAHVLTSDGHAGHRHGAACCHSACARHSESGEAALADESATAPHELCWICESLLSLLCHSEEQTALALPVCRAETPFTAVEPLTTQSVRRLYANRSQAPPLGHS